MIGTVIFCAICVVSIAFLLRVFVALCQETRPRRFARGTWRPTVVVPIPPNPIFTASEIRPAGVPENAPFSIVATPNGTVAEFYVEEGSAETQRHGRWRVLVNPRRLRTKKVM